MRKRRVCEAKEVRERALKIGNVTLTSDYPVIAAMSCNLAGILIEMGDLEEARKILERELDVFERCLPEDHPYTQNTIASLGLIQIMSNSWRDDKRYEC